MLSIDTRDQLTRLKKDGFLRNEARLSTEPARVDTAQRDAIQEDDPSSRILGTKSKTMKKQGGTQVYYYGVTLT